MGDFMREIKEGLLRGILGVSAMAHIGVAVYIE